MFDMGVRTGLCVRVFKRLEKKRQALSVKTPSAWKNFSKRLALYMK